MQIGVMEGWKTTLHCMQRSGDMRLVLARYGTELQKLYKYSRNIFSLNDYRLASCRAFVNPSITFIFPLLRIEVGLKPD